MPPVVSVQSSGANSPVLTAASSPSWDKFEGATEAPGARDLGSPARPGPGPGLGLRPGPGPASSPSSIASKVGSPVGAIGPVFGEIALHCAAHAGKSDLVRQLLLDGASTYGVDGRGRLALHYACEGGHIRCVQLLFEAGEHNAARQRDAEGHTPQLLAVLRGRRQVVMYLLRSAVDPREKDGTGRTLAEIAREREKKKKKKMM